MVKVSFDFDGTLSIPSVQTFAKYIIENNLAEVWICTSRLSIDKAPNEQWNDDLNEVAVTLGIPKERVIFTCYADKCDFLNNKGFLWHLDDDVTEISLLNNKSDCKGINFFGNKTWREECKKLLNK